LKFSLNQHAVKYSANVRCTNWGLPSTTFITIPVLSFPSWTWTKKGCISSSIVLLCNYFSM
jgi:hypothetical protein